MTASVADYFDRNAEAFDRRYDHEGAQRVLRPGLLNGRDRAVALVRELGRPRVLDIGCGPGRVAERLLEAGAREYVGVDLSRRMLDLARRRLDRYGAAVTLVQGDFADVGLDERFDAVIALGLFDYVPNAALYLRRMADLCTGVVLATFPRRNPLKHPVRRFVYGRHSTALHYFDEARLEALVSVASLSGARVERSHTGYCLCWHAPHRSPDQGSDET